MKCIFCRIAQTAETEQHRILCSSESFYAMYVLNPEQYGHLVVVPTVHMSDLGEMNDELFSKFCLETRKIAIAITNELKAKAFVIKLNNGLYKLEKDDKNHVGHLHFHVIPKYEVEKSYDRASLDYFLALPKLK